MRTYVEKPRAAHPSKALRPTARDGDNLRANRAQSPTPDVRRALGNQAVQRLATGTADGRGGIAEPGRVPVRSRVPAGIQAKLVVNAPGDAHEQEADRVADRVMRMPAPRLQRKCACGGTCPECRKEAAQDALQTKRVQPGAAGIMEAPPIVHQALRSADQPLDPAVREFMEPRLGHDFSQVRVHADAEAASAARAVQARAYTRGHDIVFGAGEYAPGTAAGMRLLAHELVHVVQQSGGAGGRGSTGAESPSAGVVQRLLGPPGPEEIARQLARRALEGPAARAGWRHFWTAVVHRFAIRGVAAATLTAADGPFPFGDLVALGLTVWTIGEILLLWDALWREAALEAARQPVNPPETAPPPQPQPQPESRPRPDLPPVTRRSEPERCPAPVNELTEFIRWGSSTDSSRTAGAWKQELIGTRLTDWTGCEVFESGIVRDECWVPGSPCPRETEISPAGHWTCSGNEWGPDWVGTGEACVNYYQQHSRLPCRISADQTMHMVTSRGPVAYKQNELYIEIHRDKVVSSRDGEEAERPWP